MESAIYVNGRLHLYKAFVRNIILYAVPVWRSTSNKLFSKLEVVERSCLRQILGLLRMDIRNEDFYREFNKTSIPFKLQYKLINHRIFQKKPSPKHSSHTSHCANLRNSKKFILYGLATTITNPPTNTIQKKQFPQEQPTHRRKSGARIMQTIAEEDSSSAIAKRTGNSFDYSHKDKDVQMHVIWQQQQHVLLNLQIFFPFQSPRFHYHKRAYRSLDDINLTIISGKGKPR